MPLPRSPLITASVGTYSGPVGTILVAMLHGTQVWVSHINRRGGVNGHPVKLLVYDDGGDPARHRAQVQEAVEQRHVVAFLQNSEPLSGRASVEYIERKRIPIVGVSTGEGWASSSPMYFPQTATGQSLYDIWVPAFASQWLPEGNRKLATLVCTESQSCTDAEKTFSRDAAAFGFDYVYRGRGSLAQPDYTAECLAARNAGAQAIFVALDQNSTSRFASSCARQGYRPKVGAASQASADRFKDDPNLDGVVVPSPTFPYFQTGTPAVDLFHEAMRSGGVTPGGGAAVGWTAGKLFELAAAGMPEPPTTEALLSKLWSLRDETLGGLTGPLTFLKDQPPPPRPCWFLTVVRQGKWTSPDGFQLRCRQG